jgi:hypothetical protein
MCIKIDHEDYFLANLKGQIWLTEAASKPLMLDQIDLLQAIADTGSITAVKVAVPPSRIMVRKCSMVLNSYRNNIISS